MDLLRSSQEYAHVTLANEPDPLDVVQASVDEGVTWSAVTVTGVSADILLRGPDYHDDTLGLLIPVTGTRVLLRLKSTPESIGRVGAVVFLY